MPRWLRWALVALAVVLSLAVVVVDVATGVWQEVPVLSGLVSGVVTFLLTVVVVDAVVARHLHKQWAPLTRIALADLLDTVTTDGVTPRSIGPDHAGRDLIAVVRQERQELGAVLARWSAFLVSDAGVDAVVQQATSVAAALDDVGEAARRGSGVAEAVVTYDDAVALLAGLVRLAREERVRGE